MEIIGAIMIGVAVIRMAAYVAEYIAKAIMGDVPGAAKALARGLAVGAIELVFALLFNLGAVIKSLRAGLKASLEALGRSTARLVTGTVRSVQRLGQIGARAGQAAAANVRRLGRVFLRNGKIVFEGLEQGFARGVRSLDDLARRLWRRLRFRRFKLQRAGRRIRLWGYINPWMLLADGSVEQVRVTGGRPEIGELVEVIGRRRAGIIIGVVDEMPSSVVQGIQALTRAERRALYLRLVSKSQDEIREILIGARQTALHARELRDNLIAAGRKALGGDHAHHIVPSTHRLAAEARKILSDFGLGINQAVNGVFVSEVLHAGLHTNKYILEVTRLLRGAKNRQDAIQILDEIAKRIGAGGFP